MKTPTEIQADFDRIALAESVERWNHNNHYHDFLLRHAPPHCGDALEVGCGTGDFARLLAQRVDRVLALDLSAEMLRLARERSTAYPNIEYLQADVMACDLPAERFDCIASIATLHHLALDAVLPRLSAALKPGGVLLVLDLCRDDGLADLARSLGAIVPHIVINRVRNSGQRPSPEARAAWKAHGASDHYLSVREVRRACADLLPGAQVSRHLFWRYSLVWTKSGFSQTITTPQPRVSGSGR